MQHTTWQAETRRMAAGIRQRVLAHTLARDGGYLSQACSAAEILAVLYRRVLKLCPLKQPLAPAPFPTTPGPFQPAITGAAYNGGGKPDGDNFILSPAQYALALYAALIEAGRMDEKGMEEYDQDGSTVEMIGAEHSPGMEVTTGSLGQGISQAAGIAMARKIKGESGRVVVLLSDGECQSGEFWEAVQAMSYHHLGNMLLYVDINGYQCDGKMTTVMNLEPFHQRLKAFGARVYRTDGHDIERLSRLGRREASDAPTFILCDTDPCRDMAVLAPRYPRFHYVRFLAPEEKTPFQEFYHAMLAREGADYGNTV
jgi:transketolase